MIRFHAAAALLVAATACATGGAGAREGGPPVAAASQPAKQTRTLRLPRLRIVDAKLGAERAARSEPLMVPFGVNQNGTELIYALLEQASAKQAAAVGDLTVYMTFRWRGGPVECRTRVMLDGDPRLLRGAARPEEGGQGSRYKTDIEVYQPQPVDFIADDRDLVCRTVRVPVVRERLVAVASDRSAESGALGDRPAGDRDLVTRFETRDECEWKQVTRRTTRYDYEVKLGFVPPDWERLSARFAKRRLVAAPPQCYTITEQALAEQPIYRITALAYHRGTVEQRMPRVLPSRTMVDAQFTPWNTPVETCIKIMNAGTGVKDTDKVEALCTVEQQRKNLARMRPKKFFEEDPYDPYSEDDDLPVQPFDAD